MFLDFVFGDISWKIAQVEPRARHFGHLGVMLGSKPRYGILNGGGTDTAIGSSSLVLE